MKTEILRPFETKRAAEIIKNGGIVALPTETVYGLGADAFNQTAVRKIFEAKGRPNDNPLIVHIAEFDHIYNLVSDVGKVAQKLLEAFWPGPLTVILHKKPNVPNEVTCGLDSVAVRLPAHPTMREVINLAKTPIAAPSANISGKPSPTSLQHVVSDMNGKIDAILDGGVCQVGLESTVISFLDNVPKILRPGFITVEQIEKVIGKIDIDENVANRTKKTEKIVSPGMKYRHYAPNAEVIILDCFQQKYVDFINSNADESVGALCFDEDINLLKVKAISFGKENDEAAQAKLFFGALRQFDELPHIKKIYARCPKKEGVGLAVYNRLLRAAEFKIKQVFC